MGTGAGQEETKSILENRTAYNIVEDEKEDSAEITMYGEVVTNRPTSYWDEEQKNKLYIVLGEFLKDLEKVKNRSKVTVRINSPGGELYAGLAIMNRLSELKGDVITIVDGLAASAASIILQGGKTRKVHNGSMIMVHGASSFLFGYYNKTKLEEALKQLNAANRTAIEAYFERTGIAKEEIQSMMDKTEWMTGQEAIAKGFADELIDTGKVSMSISEDSRYMMVNGIIMSAAGLEKLPAGLNIDHNMVIPGKNPVVADREKDKGGTQEMTAKELREKYPELVSEIVAEAEGQKEKDAKAILEQSVKNAVEEERRRISEIDEIAPAVMDRDLINKAKYEKPMTAAELALEDKKQQAKLGKKFMNELKEDGEDSGVDSVLPLPGKELKDEISQSEILSAAKLIAGIQEGE